MPGPDSIAAATLVLPGALVAYSPGPGLELIPYFIGLVTWAGLAFAAVFLAPIAAFVRRVCRIGRGVSAEKPKDVANELVPKPPAEGAGKDNP